MDTPKREPLELVQGTTLTFIRYIAAYPATAGWSLSYSLRGNGQNIQFASTASVDAHQVTVPAGITATWIPAEYELEGTAVNTDGTKRTIYLGSLTIKPDLATADPGFDTRTHAQRMLDTIETQLELLAKNVLDETDVEGTKIVRAKRAELMRQRSIYRRERQGELAREAARNGQPNPRKVKTFFSITAPGNVMGQFGAGDSVFNTKWP